MKIVSRVLFEIFLNDEDELKKLEAEIAALEEAQQVDDVIARCAQRQEERQRAEEEQEDSPVSAPTESARSPGGSMRGSLISAFRDAATIEDSTRAAQGTDAQKIPYYEWAAGNSDGKIYKVDKSSESNSDTESAPAPPTEVAVGDPEHVSTPANISNSDIFGSDVKRPETEHRVTVMQDSSSDSEAYEANTDTSGNSDSRNSTESDSEQTKPLEPVKPAGLLWGGGDKSAETRAVKKRRRECSKSPTKKDDAEKSEDKSDMTKVERRKQYAEMLRKRDELRNKVNISKSKASDIKSIGSVMSASSPKSDIQRAQEEKDRLMKAYSEKVRHANTARKQTRVKKYVLSQEEKKRADLKAYSEKIRQRNVFRDKRRGTSSSNSPISRKKRGVSNKVSSVSRDFLYTKSTIHSLEGTESGHERDPYELSTDTDCYLQNTDTDDCDPTKEFAQGKTLDPIERALTPHREQSPNPVLVKRYKRLSSWHVTAFRDLVDWYWKVIKVPLSLPPRKSRKLKRRWLKFIGNEKASLKAQLIGKDSKVFLRNTNMTVLKSEFLYTFPGFTQPDQVHLEIFARIKLLQRAKEYWLSTKSGLTKRNIERVKIYNHYFDLHKKMKAFLTKCAEKKLRVALLKWERRARVIANSEEYAGFVPVPQSDVVLATDSTVRIQAMPCPNRERMTSEVHIASVDANTNRLRLKKKKHMRIVPTTKVGNVHRKLFTWIHDNREPYTYQELSRWVRKEARWLRSEKMRDWKEQIKHRTLDHMLQYVMPGATFSNNVKERKFALANALEAIRRLNY